MKRSIPEIRVAMNTLADEIAASGLRGYARRLRGLATETIRVRTTPPTRVRQKPILPSTVRAVRKWKQEHPDNSFAFIARKFGLANGGHVSEILNGKRGKPMYDKQGWKYAKF